jgi:hypothetical protein
MAYTIEEIRNDLINYSEKDFLFKYLYRTDIWYFKEYQKKSDYESMQQFDILKKIISEHLNISFNNIIMVGSAKTGFSFAAYKCLKVFIAESNDANEKESDIDIALISPTLFDELWKEFRKEYSIKDKLVRSYVKKSIFRGFLNEKDFSKIDSVRQDWTKKVSKANRMLNDNLSIYHNVNYRIYRNWEDLEQYHLLSIKDLKKKIVEENI